MRISDWSSDLCSSELLPQLPVPARPAGPLRWKPKKQKSRCRDIGQKHLVPSFARIDLPRSGGRTPSPSPPEHQGSTQSLDWRGAGGGTDPLPPSFFCVFHRGPRVLTPERAGARGFARGLFLTRVVGV